ncbi:PDK repeat-containing protein, partial [Thermoplasmatales archaeon SCGC AB-539-N05]
DGANSAQTTFTDLWFKTFEDASYDWNKRRYIFGQGDAVYTAAYVWPWRGYKFEWYDPNNNLVHTSCQGGVLQVTDSYVLDDNAPVGTWYIKKIKYKNTDCSGSIKGVETIRFNVYDKQATLLVPMDDSYVRYFDRQKGDFLVSDGNDYCRDQNYDNDELHVKWRNEKIFRKSYLDRKRVFLKFDLSGIPDDVTIVSAKLHLDRYAGENDAEEIGTYFVSDDTWAEGGITWINQPTMGSQTDAIDVGPHDGGYIWNVTSETATEAAGDNTLSLGFRFTNEETKKHQDFYDQESDAGRKPYLEIVVQEVIEPPVADFTWSPLSPTDLDTIQFTDASTDSDGTVVAWSWNFGDGNTSTLQNLTHQYADNGTYNVTLNVTDNDGATNTTSKNIIVDDIHPVANFTYTPATPTDLDTIQFNDTSTDSDGMVVSWYWDLGDGNTSTLQNLTHQYADNGTYTVTLTVWDDDGAFN